MRKRIYIIPILLGLLLFVSYYLNVENISLRSIIFTFSFGSVEYYKPYITEVTFRYIQILIAHFIFGTYIYKHFCSASVYYFSRTKKKKKWYYIESLKMYLNIFLYVLCLITVPVLAAIVTGKAGKILAADILFFLYYLVVYSLFIFITVEIINLLSILWASNAGFVLVEILCLTFFGLYTILGEVFDEAYITGHSWLVRWNPACHLIIKIHSSKWDFLNESINRIFIDFPLSESVIVLGLFAIAVLFAGGFLVSRIDMVNQNKEGE